MSIAPISRPSAQCSAIGVLSEAEVAMHLRDQRATAQKALRSVLGTSSDEEDLIQEVLTRLLIRLRQPGEISVGAWTWKVAHNAAVDHLRAHRASPTDAALLDRAVGDGLDGDILVAELAAAIGQGLARLPDRQRDALLAQAELDGGRGGYALVAASLGVSPKAAESILARARQSLRRELDRCGLRQGPWVAAGAALRGVRRLMRPKVVVVGGAVTLAAMTLTTSALVLRNPAPRPTPLAPTPRPAAVVPSTTQTPAVGAPVAGPPPALLPAPANVGASSIPAGGGSGPAATPSEPATRIPSSASVPSAVSFPPVTSPPLAAIQAPAVTVPSVTVPPVTLPAVTLPAVTIPGVSIPAVTLPAVSLPPVTLPAVSIPPVSLPGVSLPGVNVPSVPLVPSLSIPAVPLTPPVVLPPVKL